jgi:hypothetical protein
LRRREDERGLPFRRFDSGSGCHNVDRRNPVSIPDEGRFTMIKKSELKTQAQLNHEKYVKLLEERIDEMLTTQDLPIHVSTADIPIEAINEIKLRYENVGEYVVKKQFTRSYTRQHCMSLVLS